MLVLLQDLAVPSMKRQWFNIFECMRCCITSLVLQAQQGAFDPCLSPGRSSVRAAPCQPLLFKTYRVETPGDWIKQTAYYLFSATGKKRSISYVSQILHTVTLESRDLTLGCLTPDVSSVLSDPCMFLLSQYFSTSLHPQTYHSCFLL